MAICLGLALAVQIKPYAHAWITDARANIAIQSFQVERALQRLTAKSPHANDDEDEGGVIFVFVFCVFCCAEREDVFFNDARLLHELLFL